jgi:hypothetical protein
MGLALLRLSVKPFAAGDTPSECNTIPPGGDGATWAAGCVRCPKGRFRSGDESLTKHLRPQTGILMPCRFRTSMPIWFCRRTWETLANLPNFLHTRARRWNCANSSQHRPNVGRFLMACCDSGGYLGRRALPRDSSGSTAAFWKTSKRVRRGRQWIWTL